MKWIFLLLVLFLMGCSSQQGVCTTEAKMCPDGSNVGRSGPDCEFAPCPDVEVCDVMNSCPEGKDCYAFPDEGFICFSGDPCVKCPSRECAVAESYPMQVICQ